MFELWLDGCAVQVPDPVAAIAVEPPGKEGTQLTFLSTPAFGFAVTVIVAVSAQPLVLVHIKL